MIGNCYATSEAVYHLLGGKRAGWKPMQLYHEGSSHWYLQHESGLILDLTCSQFKTKVPYHTGKGKGFLTKGPSKYALDLMKRMVWQ